MGVKINALSGGKKDYVEATAVMSRIFHRRSVSPWLHREWMLHLMPTGAQQRKALKILHGFDEKVRGVKILTNHGLFPPIANVENKI